MVIGTPQYMVPELITGAACDGLVDQYALAVTVYEVVCGKLPFEGPMAAVFGPLQEIERIVAGVDGYVVVANINSTSQAVVGGATDAVEHAIAACQAAGMNATRIPAPGGPADRGDSLPQRRGKRRPFLSL